MKTLFKLLCFYILASFCYTLTIPVNTLTDVIKEKRTETRIVGGINAPRDVAPHMVALVVIFYLTSHLICGGSIISSRLVLTAAHCIDAVRWGDTLQADFAGVLGSNEWQSTDYVVHFDAFVIHPEYDRWLIKNDIGLLITEHNIQMGPYVQPIELEFEWVGGEEAAYATGWGMTGAKMEDDVVSLSPIPDKLQMLEMKTMDSQECANEVHLGSLVWGWAPHIDPLLEICTYHSVGHGMCRGDSGSAVVSSTSGSQMGLVSWGFACALGVPDVHVRLAAFQHWITIHLHQYQSLPDDNSTVSDR